MLELTQREGASKEKHQEALVSKTRYDTTSLLPQKRLQHVRGHRGKKGQQSAIARGINEENAVKEDVNKNRTLRYAIIYIVSSKLAVK